MLCGNSKKYAYFIGVLLVVLAILYVYKINDNYKISENMVNISKINKPSWSRNKCSYDLTNTIKRVLDDHNIINRDGGNGKIMFPCGYDEISNELAKFNPKPNNSYFVVNQADELIAKDLLWKHLVAHYGLNKAKTIMPMSYILYDEKDKNRFDFEYDKHKIYIMKKNIQRQEGLHITTDKNVILKGSADHYVVVQELLQNPYTIADNLNNQINNRKINMRFYILVICNQNDMDVYVHKNGFMYYTKESFVKGSLRSESNITTGYIDRKIYDKSPLTHDDFRTYLDSDRNITDHERNIKKHGLILSKVVFERIYNLLRDVFIAIVGKICTKCKLSDGISFQLFGADIALDDKLNPMIMEINKGPDLGSKDERDGSVKYKVVSDIFRKIKAINDNKKNDFKQILEVTNSNIVSLYN